MPFQGELAALLTAFLWSGTSIVFTEATTRVGSIMVNITRMVIALLLLGVSIPLLGLDFSLSATQMSNLVISGVLGLVLGDTFLFRAFKDIGARVSMLLMALVPGMTALLAWIFLGEALSLQSIAGMLVTMAGIAVVILERPAVGGQVRAINLRGIVLGVLAALGQASGLIFAKFALNEAPIHGMVATAVRIGASVAIFLPLAVLLKWYGNPFRVYARDRKALAFTSIGAVIGPYLGITFSLVAIANTEVAVATTIMSLPPILMLPLVRTVYKERLTARAIGGAVLAVAGVALLFLR
ncbi:MAG: DMT family transporter [Bacteroidia bacterium]|nr:DMT family transporter [Bacteroidia bacterium]